MTTAQAPAPIRVEIWSDVVCPWCWIGEASLLQAAEQIGVSKRLRVTMRAFRLDPRDGIPREPVADRVRRKYGWSDAEAAARLAELTQRAADVGIELRLDRAISAPSLDAHRLITAARATGDDLAIAQALHRLHFTDGGDLSDHAHLRTAVVDAGLDASLADDVLGSDRHADDVALDITEAQALGVQGVPFFVLASRYALTGAQPVDVMAEGLRRAV